MIEYPEAVLGCLSSTSLSWDNDEDNQGVSWRNLNQLWYVYATPMSPATCPLLDLLAMYLFANPGLSNM
jgi:hypothetical protein